MRWSGVALFIITYGLISARRLEWLRFDRPAGALVGAVAFVVFGILTPRQALDSVDGATLLLLFGVMGMGAFLSVHGFFDRAEEGLVRLARTPPRLLGLIVWTAGPLSALITNDAVCILGAPLVVRIIQKHRLTPLPFLLALATASNTGSVATLVGNPQNMLCGLLGGLTYRHHVLLMAPVAAAGLLINHGILRWLFRKTLPKEPFAKSETRSEGSWHSHVTLGVIAATTVVYTLGGDLAWTATAGFAVLMLIHRTDTQHLWKRIDWSLLLFFASLFVVVEGLNRSGAPAWFFQQYPLGGRQEGMLEWFRLSAIFLVGSNIVSNVPFILVIREAMGSLANPIMGWELLAMASTFAGNLTLLGSVANIIVAEASRDIGGIGFWQYLRVGFPLTLLSTLVGTVWMALIGPGW